MPYDSSYLDVVHSLDECSRYKRGYPFSVLVFWVLEKAPWDAVKKPRGPLAQDWVGEHRWFDRVELEPGFDVWIFVRVGLHFLTILLASSPSTASFSILLVRRRVSGLRTMADQIGTAKDVQDLGRSWTLERKRGEAG